MAISLTSSKGADAIEAAAYRLCERLNRDQILLEQSDLHDQFDHRGARR
jgi:hypothetical protein